MKYWSKLFLSLTLCLLLCACGQGGSPGGTSSAGTSSSSDSYPALSDSLAIRDISRYAGSFVEDGSDELVSDVFALTVENTGDKTVQYAHITLTLGEGSYDFDLTTLPPGARVQLLELNRQPLPENTDGMTAAVTSFAAFETEPSLCEDVLAIETQDAGITLTNISGEDITGQIYVYYKVAYGDLYLGGITYRAGLSGLAAGQSATGYAGHFSQDQCRVMFVTYVP